MPQRYSPLYLYCVLLLLVVPVSLRGQAVSPADSLRRLTPPPPPALSPADSAYRANPRRLDSLQRLMQAADEQRTMDPALQRVPADRLEGAYEQLAKQKGTTNSLGIPNLTWAERGPLGFIAKIRTQLIDPNDPAQKKVWAGSEVGGLWFTPDITDPTASWRVVSDAWENRNVSALAADPTNPQVMYAGTGEMIVNPYLQRGGGIWKTTNGGASWQRLSSTIPSSGSPLQAAFFGISKLAVNPSGWLFAATMRGVVRSTDGGATWAFVLAPQQAIGATPVSGGDDGISDLEIGSDGTLFVATRTGRLFRAGSAAGTAWTEITPPSTTPYNNTRTELALAPSTSGGGQVIYATGIHSNNSNYNRDVKWFLKSTDAGATWTAMTRPEVPYSTPGNQDFTYGSGVSTLVMAVLPNDPSAVYVGGHFYLHPSTDGGQTWGTASYSDRLTTFSVRPQGAIWSSYPYGMSFSPLPLTDYIHFAYRRNRGFGGVPVASAAMRNVPGSPGVFALVSENLGLLEQTQPGVGEGVQATNFSGSQVFVDQDQPGVHLGVSPWGSMAIRNTATNSDFSWYNLPGNSFRFNPAIDYDSRSNTLFTYNNGYYKVTDVGGQNTISAWNGLSLGRPTAMRVGPQENTLYVAVEPYTNGVQTAQLYRVLNTHTNAPTLARIDNGAFPVGASISTIEVGATDNQLLVTFSNYGVKSVWLSTNIGESWTSKDEPGHGLPDIPVYGATFNPANDQQVMLATELGVWTTTDIAAANPGWEASTSGMPLVRINQLRARRSDGRVLAGTEGRGVWETNVWAVPNTPPQLAVSPLSNPVLCQGSVVQVGFTLTNGSSSRFGVRLSDASGSFANSQLLATGTGSPLAVTVPYVPYGTQYRLRVEALDLGVSGIASETITISDLTKASAQVKDRRNYYNSALAQYGFANWLCPGSTATLRAAYFNTEPFRPSVSIRWAVNGIVLAAQQSTTLAVNTSGTYNFTATEGGCTLVSNNYTLTTLSSLNNSVAYDFGHEGPRCSGSPVVIGVGTLGESATYQWYRDGTPIAGATSSTYAVTESGAYSYSVQEGTCSLTNSASQLLTFSNTIYPPSLYTGYNSLTLCGGSSAYMTATSPTINDAYQWLKDGSPIGGATSSFYYTSTPGLYTLRLRRGNCVALSEPVVVTSGNQLGNEVVVSGSTTVCSGTTKYLGSKLTSVNLQWMRDGVDIPGATNSWYYASTTGAYTVRTLSGSCSVTAAAVHLTFTNRITPTIRSFEACTSVDLYEQGFIDLTPKQYTWFRDGVAVSSGGNYHYATQSGLYSFSASYGASCTGRSEPVRIIIGAPAGPTIVANSAVQRCANSAARLSQTGGYGSYWKKDGSRIPNSTANASYYPVESGRYSLVYDQNGCYVESDPIDVVIGAPTAGTLTGSAVVQAGQAAVLPVGFSGVAPWSFTLSSGQSVQNVYQNPYSLSLTPATTTSYSLVATRSNCGVGQATGTARVTIGSGSADVALSSAVSSRTPRVGEVISYSFTVSNAGPQDAEGVQLTDRLPNGLLFVDGSPGWQTAADGSLSISIGNVPVGSERVVNLRARATTGGVYVNAAELSSSQTPDPDSHPGTGTADGQDDATQADFRTSEADGPLLASANPTAQLLPPVQSNQPTPSASQADLSLHMAADQRVAKAKQTVTIAMRIANEGGKTATGVRVDVLIPNGSYLNASNNWVLLETPTVVPFYVNRLNANSTVTVPVYWRPLTTGQLRGEIAASDVTDPDSTPGNQTTRAGEDDEANVSIDVR